MAVRRTLPQRARSLVGAWCFVDHYGPEATATTGGMRVNPHPHIGLQTVSWLFAGEVEHRDSAGNHALVRPGELNLMTAGRGISHSEYSTPSAEVLAGAQLWVALPDGARRDAPRFDHYVPDPVATDAYQARVFLGSLVGSTSPVATATPLLGAELVLDPGADVDLEVDPAFEHGVLVDSGEVGLAGTSLGRGELGVVDAGPERLRLAAGDSPVRVVILGGPPFEEEVVMWWNFVGRSHDEIAEARSTWEEELASGEGPFGWPVGDGTAPVLAPALPPGRLQPRTAHPARS